MIEEVTMCSKCGQIILTDTLIKRLKDKYNKDRIYRREWKRKKALEKKLSKDVKPLTDEEIEKVKQ